jgi:queuine/archaeosine tRNA-ribosyltransferase
MPLERPASLTVGNVRLELPVFFPSVSSVKTALPPLAYVELLAALAGSNPQFLISAYDLLRSTPESAEALRGLIGRTLAAGAVVVMDSGNYESYWKDAGTGWPQSSFHDVLRRCPCSMAFGFDDQNPPFEPEEHSGLVVSRWVADQQVAGNTPVIPIVHGTPERLPSLCARVADTTAVQLIAVPERRLGEGIFQRAGSVKAVRAALDSIGRYVGLHLLGTGNPLSLAVYALAGADSFDGLEWCQTVVDHETALLFHFSHADFFRHQSVWGDGRMSFQARTLAHNLAFYSDWMTLLRRALREGGGVDFCRRAFPARVFKQCATGLGWESEP